MYAKANLYKHIGQLWLSEPFPYGGNRYVHITIVLLLCVTL